MLGVRAFKLTSQPCVAPTYSRSFVSFDCAAQDAVVEHADRLLPLLAALTAYQPSADARRGALDALTPLAMELPRHVRCHAVRAQMSGESVPQMSGEALLPDTRLFDDLLQC